MRRILERIAWLQVLIGLIAAGVLIFTFLHAAREDEVELMITAGVLLGGLGWLGLILLGVAWNLPPKTEKSASSFIIVAVLVHGSLAIVGSGLLLFLWAMRGA